MDIFSELSKDDEAIQLIKNICTTRRIQKGKMIIEEDSIGDELFIIVSGEIDILKKTLQDEKYTVTTLKADMGGIYVGELALIDNDKRSATVLANTDCHCIVINRKDFINLGNRYPEIGLKVTRAIARQISRRPEKDQFRRNHTLFSAGG